MIIDISKGMWTTFLADPIGLGVMDRNTYLGFGRHEGVVPTGWYDVDVWRVAAGMGVWEPAYQGTKPVAIGPESKEWRDYRAFPSVHLALRVRHHKAKPSFTLRPLVWSNGDELMLAVLKHMGVWKGNYLVDWDALQGWSGQLPLLVEERSGYTANKISFSRLKDTEPPSSQPQHQPAAPSLDPPA